jgi:hypothetical protein
MKKPKYKARIIKIVTTYILIETGEICYPTPQERLMDGLIGLNKEDVNPVRKYQLIQLYSCEGQISGNTKREIHFLMADFIYKNADDCDWQIFYTHDPNKRRNTRKNALG